jgi:hypothetical protein
MESISSYGYITVLDFSGKFITSKGSRIQLVTCIGTRGSLSSLINELATLCRNLVSASPVDALSPLRRWRLHRETD